MVRPSSRREAEREAVKEKGVPVQVACVAFMVSETCYRYESKSRPEDGTIASWLISLTECHRRWDFGLYRELELNLRIKPHKRIRREKPEAIALPTGPNEMWSMDFMSDSLENGRPFRTINVIERPRRPVRGRGLLASVGARDPEP